MNELTVVVVNFSVMGVKEILTHHEHAAVEEIPNKEWPSSNDEADF